MKTSNLPRETITQIIARRTVRAEGASRSAQITAGNLAKQLLNNGISAASSIALARKTTLSNCL